LMTTGTAFTEGTVMKGMACTEGENSREQNYMVGKIPDDDVPARTLYIYNGDDIGTTNKRR